MPALGMNMTCGRDAPPPLSSPSRLFVAGGVAMAEPNATLVGVRCRW
jgi:hypothetical protein